MGGVSARIEFKEERICGGVAGCTCLQGVIQTHSVIFIAAEDIGSADTGRYTHTHTQTLQCRTKQRVTHQVTVSSSPTAVS